MALQGLRSRHAVRLVVHQHVHYDFLHFDGHVRREQFFKTSACLLGEIELHVTGDFLKLF